MMRRKKNWFVSILKPLSVAMIPLLFFVVLCLRSGVVSLEYKLSSLDKKKMELMKDKKVLMAEKARLLSIERFEKVAGDGFVFVIPDRVRVVSIKSVKGNDTYNASYAAHEKLAARNLADTWRN
ncbi:MAG: hypothetical protein ACLPX5_09165 [Dissulfurispiraceae bacterium]